MFPLKIPVNPKSLNSIERERFWCKNGQISAKSITQLIKIEQAICDSHLKEKLNEESIAVAKIKSDPNFFLQICKKK